MSRNSGQGTLLWTRAKSAKLANEVAVLKDTSLVLRRALRTLGAMEFEIETRAPDITITTGIDFYQEVQRFECTLIRSALKHTGGHQRRAASLLRLKPTTLNDKIKAYKIDPKPRSEKIDNRKSTVYVSESSKSGT